MNANAESTEASPRATQAKQRVQPFAADPARESVDNPILALV
jgi:hypothetical protein